MSKRIGIDLGTTNSVVAVFENGAPRIVTGPGGARTIPSIVGFLPRGGRLVGHDARDQQITNPANTVYSVKRFMGRRRAEVARAEKQVPYEIVGKPKEHVRIRIGRKEYTPQEISAMILRDLKANAEAHLGTTVEKAVISVPAHFDDAQRQATRDAGAIAGLEVERIINEPTAAAIAYGLEKLDRKRIVVLDFGGGTLDLAAMDIENGVFRVLAVDGDTYLGGDDFDHRIIDIVADDFRRREAIDLRREPMALQRLKRAAERAKVDLSSRLETTIELPFIFIDERGPKHLKHTLARNTFEALATDLLDELRERCRILLYGAGLHPNAIDEVVLVGGATRMPKVQEIAQEVFQRSRLDSSVNPDEVVAAGAAVLAGVLDGDAHNVALMDVTSHTIGIETYDGTVTPLIPKHAPVPTKVRRVFTTPRDQQRGVPIRLCAGEGPHVEDNRTLSLFHLRGIERARSGKTRIEVEVEIDANGILSVRAVDGKTGVSREALVHEGVGLDRREIERMKRIVRKMEVEGAIRIEEQERQEQAEQTLAEMTSWLEFNQRVMPARTVAQLRVALERLEQKVKTGDVRGMRSAVARVRRIMPELRRSA